jgi:UDP-4-amino-4,6-dideoxy-N-acetyl-beta-L-altrosamine transaminase
MSTPAFLPYSRQQITAEDIESVVDVLRSDWMTQGPVVPQFETDLAGFVGAAHAVACSSGTAALHLAMLALGLGEGDVVVTSPNTFVASANCARFVGAKVLFADVDHATGLIDPAAIARLLKRDDKHKIKAIIPVHFAGQPADLPTIHALAKEHGAWVVDDASHALGAWYEQNNQRYQVGANPHSDLTTFSFHPLKHIAMGEGGAVTTNHADLAERLALYRSHGVTRHSFINTDMAFAADGIPNPWYYEMDDIGFNYRLTEMQAALGISQLDRLSRSLQRRQEIADQYRKLIADTFAPGDIRPLAVRSQVGHAYHLFVVQIAFDRLGVSRAVVMNRLRAEGIGTQVHYIPVHLQPYYRRVSPTDPWSLPGTEEYYTKALSLPMFPELSDEDIARVVGELAVAVGVKKIQQTVPHR